MDKDIYIKNIINVFNENGVFSEEQVNVLSKSLAFIVDGINEWMYEEVLPKTINADNESFGSDRIIKKCETIFK